MADAKRVDAGAGGIGAITDLANLFGGKTTTTKNSADTGALQQLLQSLQGQDYSKMLESIFAQAAGQMPGLQARFANAVGSRSGNNGAVQAALQKLLQDTALKGQQQVAQMQLQNQNLQGDVAGKIAQLNSSQKQSQGTDLTKVAQGLGALQLAGKLIDSPLGKKTGELWDGLFSSTESSTGVADFGANFDFSNMFGGGDVAGGVGDIADFGGDSTDFFNVFSDYGAAGDVASYWDSADAIADVGSDGGGFFEGLFGFADGGLVGRDQQRLGSAGGRKGAAPTFNPIDLLRSVAVSSPIAALNPARQVVAPQQQQPEKREQVSAGDSESESGNGFSLGLGALGTAKDAQDAAVAKAFSRAMLGMMSPVGIPGVTSSPVNAVVTGVKAGLAQQRAMDALNQSQDPIGALAVANGWLSQDATNAMGSDALSAAANALATMTNQDPMEGLMSVTNAFGTAASAGGLDNGLGGLEGLGMGMGFGPGYSVGAAAGLAAGQSAASEGSDSGSSDGGFGGDGGDGGGAGGDGGSDGGGGYGRGGDGGGFGGADGEKDGGHIKGPGTGTSDSIPARLSNGEYVVSADTVKTLGVDFFDRLQQLFHNSAGL
jgi:hypothetical protein